MKCVICEHTIDGCHLEITPDNTNSLFLYNFKTEPDNVRGFRAKNICVNCCCTLAHLIYKKQPEILAEVQADAFSDVITEVN